MFKMLNDQRTGYGPEFNSELKIKNNAHGMVTLNGGVARPPCHFQSEETEESSNRESDCATAPTNLLFTFPKLFTFQKVIFHKSKVRRWL